MYISTQQVVNQKNSHKSLESKEIDYILSNIDDDKEHNILHNSRLKPALASSLPSNQRSPPFNSEHSIYKAYRVIEDIYKNWGNYSRVST